MKKAIVWTALVWLVPVTAWAAPAATVEMLQPPVWLDRGGPTVALTRTSDLRSGDVIRTGSDARARIGLAEGSDIKIGSNARVRLPKLEPASESGGFFQGVVDVVRGAFRYTTGAIGADRQRQIDFKVGTVTAGVRGTDIWGKTTSERSFVVLLDGEIEAGNGTRSARLGEPGTAFIQPHQSEPRVGVAIDSATIKKFARQTEPLAERGRLQPDGDWAVMLDSLRARSHARKTVKRYRKAGFPVELRTARVAGTQWYRVVLPGTSTRAGARSLAARFEHRFNVSGAWVQAKGDGRGE